MDKLPRYLRIVISTISRNVFLQVKLNKNARQFCSASFDGHHQLKVFPGDRCVNFKKSLRKR